jgi:hypothetical protein
MHELSVAIVGIGYDNDDGSNRLFHLRMQAPGDTLELRREPRNEHDEYAVSVYCRRGYRLGFVPAERAPWLGAKILDGLEVQAVFQELQEKIAVLRVRIGGGAPTLPASRIRGEAEEPDFYPDPDGPEWGA